MQPLVRASLAAAALIVTPRLQAHHSASAFDIAAPLLRLEGVVTEVEWASPHVYVYMELGGEDGERWALEGDAPGAHKRMGWDQNTFRAGDRVVATVSPPRDPDARVGHLMTIAKDDGTEWNYLDLASAFATPSSAGARTESLAGLWEVQIDFNVLFQEPMIQVGVGTYPLTERGQESAKAHSDDTMPTLDCIPWSPPHSMIGGLIAIAIDGDTLTLRESEFGTTRTVHLDLASHEGAEESLLGHSIGSWDDGDLVVDTTHFAEHREGNLTILPSSAERHLVERFSLAADRRSLVYRYELTDPVYLAEPAAFEYRFNFAPEADFEAVPCSTDNARRFLED